MAFADPELWRQRRGWRPLRIRTRRPVLAWIVATAVLGGFALLSITGPSSGKTAAKSPAPLPAMVPAPVTIPVSKSSPGTQSPARHRPSPRHTAKTAAGQLSPRQPATATAPSTAPAATRTPRSSASPRRSSTPAPAVLVRYLVDGVSGGAFQGEVDVVNNGRQPLAGWQIVVALEGDKVTAVQNATGFDSNGILLMQPATSSEVVPPDGGTLRVFFAARGPRTIPLACAFNSISCQ